MANLLSHVTKNISYSISNGWTTVLYSTLLISCSRLAKTNWEKRFMIWLAEHDQNYVGLGFAGIDFEDICWSPSDFEEQKEFVIAIAKNAIEEKLWKKLDPKTNVETITSFLNLWIELFSNARADDIKPIDDFAWYNKPNLPDDLNRQCFRYKIYLNKLGKTERECCYLCSNS